MNKDKIEVVRLFIRAYEAAKDKEQFIKDWKSIINDTDDVLTKKDALDSAYGSALEQIYAE